MDLVPHTVQLQIFVFTKINVQLTSSKDVLTIGHPYLLITTSNNNRTDGSECLENTHKKETRARDKEQEDGKQQSDLTEAETTCNDDWRQAAHVVHER